MEGRAVKDVGGKGVGCGNEVAVGEGVGKGVGVALGVGVAFGAVQVTRARVKAIRIKGANAAFKAPLEFLIRPINN